MSNIAEVLERHSIGPVPTEAKLSFRSNYPVVWWVSKLCYSPVSTVGHGAVQPVGKNHCEIVLFLPVEYTIGKPMQGSRWGANREVDRD